MRIFPLGRRGTLACGAAALACGCGARFAAVAAEARPGDGPAMDPRRGYVVAPIRDGLFYVGDGGYNAMFLVTRAGVVVVDAPPTLGANYLRAIAEVTDRPVTHLVYTHEHVDHIAGSGAFPGDVAIVAHRSTAELLYTRRDPRRRMPTQVWDGPRHRLEVGGEVLDLAWHGVSHSLDTTFVHAPRQRTLMVVDVVYPGWMPYKNLGVAVDVPGFCAAHATILGYEFDTLVAGHVSRPGTRADVETQLELIRDLARAAERAYAALGFPAFLLDNPPDPRVPGRSSWELHDAYERALVDLMAAEIGPRWRGRLAGVEPYLRDNCWAMLETYVVQGAPPV